MMTQNQGVLRNFQEKEEATQKIFQNHAEVNHSAVHRINLDFLHAAKNHLVVHAMIVTIQNQDALRNFQEKTEVTQKILNPVAVKHLAAQRISHQGFLLAEKNHSLVRAMIVTIQNQEDHLSFLVIAIQNQDVRIIPGQPIMRSQELKDVIRVHAMTEVTQS